MRTIGTINTAILVMALAGCGSGGGSSGGGAPVPAPAPTPLPNPVPNPTPTPNPNPTPSPDAQQSTLSATPTSGLIADGQDSARIIVTVNDSNGAAMANQSVTFAVQGSGASIAPNTVTTAANGQGSATLIATSEGPKDISATINPGPNQVVVRQTVTVTFDPMPVTPPPPSGTGTNGSGGRIGLQTRSVTVSGQSFDYLVYAPPSYDPAVATPTLFVFHGQGGSNQVTLGNWRSIADANGFLLAATQNTGAQGGWSFQTDTPIFSAALSDMDSAFNVETRRRYIWGFSAGGHFCHTIGLANSQVFAAYATSAGVLTNNVTATRLIPVSMHVGLTDPLLTPVRQTRDLLLSRGHPVDFHEFQGGHTVRASHRAQVWDDLKDHRLP